MSTNVAKAHEIKKWQFKKEKRSMNEKAKKVNSGCRTDLAGRKKLQSRDWIKIACFTIVMFLATRIITPYYANFTFLKYVFFVVPVFFIIGGIALAYTAERALHVLLGKIIVVLVCSISIFGIFISKFDVNLIIILIIVILFHYLYIQFGARLTLLLRRKSVFDNGNKYRFVLDFWMIFLLFLISIPLYFYITLPIKKEAYSEVLIKYLNKKYDNRFVVSKMKTVYDLPYCIEIPPVYYAYAVHSINHSNIKANAWVSPFKGCDDGYGRAVAVQEAREFIKPYIDKITDNNYFEVEIQPKYYDEKGDMVWDKKVAAELYSLKIPFKKVLNDNKGKFYISLNVYYAYDVTKENKKQIFKNVFKFIQYLKKNGIYDLNINICYYTEEDFKNKTIEQVYEEDPLSFIPQYRREFIIRITHDNMSEIKSYKDISSYFFRGYDINQIKTVNKEIEG